MARPTVRNIEIDRKMDEAAALGCTIEEIALFAGIHRDTLYDWIKKDKELSDRIEELRENPILKARTTLVNSLDNPENAKWFLERKRRLEFSTKQEIEVKGQLSLSQTIQNNELHTETDH